MPSDLTAHPLDTRNPALPPAATNERGRRVAPTLSVGGRALDWRQAVGGGLVVLGVIAIVVAWFQIAGTAEVWKQLPYVASGGIGGAALIAIGLTLIVAYEHANDRDAIGRLLVRLDSLEYGPGGGSSEDPGAEGNVDTDSRDQLLERLAALEAALAGMGQEAHRTKSRANGTRRA